MPVSTMSPHSDRMRVVTSLTRGKHVLYPGVGNHAHLCNLFALDLTQNFQKQCTLILKAFRREYASKVGKSGDTGGEMIKPKLKTKTTDDSAEEILTPLASKPFKLELFIIKGFREKTNTGEQNKNVTIENSLYFLAGFEKDF